MKTKGRNSGKAKYQHPGDLRLDATILPLCYSASASLGDPGEARKSKKCQSPLRTSVLQLSMESAQIKL